MQALAAGGILKDDPCYKHRMVILAKIPVRMTVGEFLKWDSDDGRRYELVDDPFLQSS